MPSYQTRWDGPDQATDIYCSQAEDVRPSVTLTDDVSGAAVSLVGASLTLTVRASAEDTGSPLLALTGTANSHGSVLTITSASAGQYQFFIDNVDIAALFAAGANTPGASTFSYDVLLTASGGDRTRILFGNLTIAPGDSR